MTRSRRREKPEAPRLEPGIQPEIDGKLQCLMCGNLYSQLGQHVVTKHQISADDYRARFGLPARRGLHSSRVQQVRAERGRTQWRTDPELRQRLTPTKTTPEQRAAHAAAARKATASRPGVKAAARAGGQAAHRAWLAAVDRGLTEAASRAGFASLDAMLTATADLPAHEVARMLGVTTKQAEAARRRHAPHIRGRILRTQRCLECDGWYRGFGQHVRNAHHLTMEQYRQRHPLTATTLDAFLRNHVRLAQPPLTGEQLTALAPGEQPEDGSGRRACRECGRWYRSIGHHVTAAHHLTVDQYRRRHGIQRRRP